MPSQRKALMQQLVSEIRVESRSEIFPTYRLPAPPVRVISGVVGRGGLEPPASAVDRTERCANDGFRSQVDRASRSELCGAPIEVIAGGASFATSGSHCIGGQLL